LEKEGITSEELLRAREPLVTSLKQSIKTNQYWLNSVLSLSARYPRQLDWPRTIVSDYTSINATEVNELAARYLDNGKAAVVRVEPETGTKNDDTLALTPVNGYKKNAEK
jgi:zinc protease